MRTAFLQLAPLFLASGIALACVSGPREPDAAPERGLGGGQSAGCDDACATLAKLHCGPADAGSVQDCADACRAERADGVRRDLVCVARAKSCGAVDGCSSRIVGE